MDLHKREKTGLPLLIAEVGFNHAGSRETAANMIRAAASAGADAVKFQTFRAANLALPSATHFELICAGEMTRDDALFLAGEARAAGIDFFSTPFSLAAVEILEEAGVPAYKVASMDVTTPYLLDAVAATGKPVILSTGMSSLEEIGTAVERLTRGGAKEVALLHCLSLYPVEASDCNLLAMVELKRAFGLPTGWSDHFPGAKACLAAYAAGAEIIETHFTLDCQTPGGDHSHSLDPAMLQGLLEDMRLFASMQGGPGFFSARPDREYAPVFRRGVHAAKPLAAGAVPGPGDLLFCRPLEGLSPGDMERLAGRPLKRAVSAHAPLKIEDFDG